MPWRFFARRLPGAASARNKGDKKLGKAYIRMFFNA